MSLIKPTILKLIPQVYRVFIQYESFKNYNSPLHKGIFCYTYKNVESLLTSCQHHYSYIPIVCLKFTTKSPDQTVRNIGKHSS